MTEQNRLTIGIVGVAFLILVLFGVFRHSPSIGNFVGALNASSHRVETFTGSDLKEMNFLANSGKSGALIFTIIARAVVYANGALSKSQADKNAAQALEEMTTIKVDGVLVTVWRYAFGWQARATLAIENLVHAKDMASVQGNYCREPGNEIRITCSKFSSFVYKNFFVSISYVKYKIVLDNGKFFNYSPYDDRRVQEIRSVIEGLKF